MPGRVYTALERIAASSYGVREARGRLDLPVLVRHHPDDDDVVIVAAQLTAQLIANRMIAPVVVGAGDEPHRAYTLTGKSRLAIRQVRLAIQVGA